MPLQGVIRAVAGINYPDTLLAVASLAAGEGRGWSGEHLLAAESGAVLQGGTEVQLGLCEHAGWLTRESRTVR